jgi:hypothetical protein|tara:strand:+ start:989 stop:1315 length:327 start_codon:yes stop_codon:yes gene_type:complete
MFENFADEETPTPDRNWKNLSDEQRINLVTRVTKSNVNFEIISIIKAHKSGKVFVTLSETVTAAERGRFLLDYEEYLKESIDQGLNVWCEPLGDRNSLRKLRGIEIKT